MENLGRYLIVFGFILMLVGAGVYLAARFGVPLGRLPGDIHVERDGVGFHFPIATSIILSVVLTLLINVLFRVFRK